MKIPAFPILTAVALAAGMVAAAAQPQQNPPPRGMTEVLDRTLRPAYDVSLGIVTESSLEGYGNTGAIETDGGWQFAYFMNVLQGDIDLNLDYGLTLLTGDGGAADLPSQLGRLGLDAGATWHFVNNVDLEARAKPGLYNDIKGLGTSSFYMPVSVVGTKQFDPVFSGAVGLEVRQDFERTVMPVIEFGAKLHERVHLKVGVPDSLLTCYATRSLTPYAGTGWQSTTYRLDDDRRELTLEDFRLFAGLKVRTTEELQLAVEMGETLSRNFEFGTPRQGVERTLSSDSAFYVRLALIGPF